VSGDVREKPWLVVFYSAASGPCRRAEGFLAQVLQRNANHDTFRIFRVERERDPDAFAKFAVDVVPTLVVVKDKLVRDRLEHPRGCRQIETFLRPWLRRSAPAQHASDDHEGQLDKARASGR
jgi:thioredoxin-like negative regulator of GroEL